MPVHPRTTKMLECEAVMPSVQTFTHCVLPMAEEAQNWSSRIERAFIGSDSGDLRAKSWQIRKSENYQGVTLRRMVMQQESGCQTDAREQYQSQNQTAFQDYHPHSKNEGGVAEFGQTELYRCLCQPALVLGYYLRVDARRMAVSCRCVGRIFTQDCRLRFERTLNGRFGRRSSQTSLTDSNTYSRIGVSFRPGQSVRQRICTSDSRTLPPEPEHEQHRMLLRQCDQRNIFSHTENGINFGGTV